MMPRISDAKDKFYILTVAMCDTASLSRVGMLAASSGVSVAMSTDGVDG